MLDLGVENAAAYLAQRGYRTESIFELGGGVSNIVLLAEGPGFRLVLKQALGKLRVEQDWFSDRTRIFREAEALRTLAPALPPGSVPEVLFEDRANCLFAMSAAPPGAITWKNQLLDGCIQVETASGIGDMLAAMWRASSGRRHEWKGFSDQTVFDQLRLDPYYRSTALRHPDLAEHFDALLQDCLDRRAALVHGDWSPKNFLVSGASVVAIDFEVIHYGNPAFDTAFLLNHLALKSFYRPQWRDRYAGAAAAFWAASTAGAPEAAWLEQATIGHLGGLMLARVDGKSPAEYIRDEALKQKVRQFARNLMLDPPRRIAEVFESL